MLDFGEVKSLSLKVRKGRILILGSSQISMLWIIPSFGGCSLHWQVSWITYQSNRIPVIYYGQRWIGNAGHVN